MLTGTIKLKGKFRTTKLHWRSYYEVIIKAVAREPAPVP